jgi:hypothetical protein
VFYRNLSSPFSWYISTLKEEVFWVMMPSGLVVGYRSFRGICHLHLQGRRLYRIITQRTTIQFFLLLQMTVHVSFSGGIGFCVGNVRSL